MPNHTADPDDADAERQTHTPYPRLEVSHCRAGPTRVYPRFLTAADPESVIMHAASTSTENHSDFSTNSGFEQVVTSLPDIPEKEVIISELDGAVLPLHSTHHSHIHLCCAVLQSIYGDQAISPWRPSSAEAERAIPLSQSHMVRYQVSLRYDHHSPLSQYLFRNKV